MRRLLLLSVLALAAVLAACSSSSGPGWTYAPPTEPPASQPAASGDASAPPASEAPSGEAPSGEAPSGEAPSGGVVLDLVASQVQWQQKELQGPADTAFVIRLDNQDAGVLHNVEIKDASGATIFRGDTFTGVATKDYPIDPLPAGTYQYICTVHPNMVGTLTIGG